MKKYIRLNDGKVYEVDKWETDICVKTNHGWVYKTDIVAESDNITDLIMVGDLVEVKEHSVSSRVCDIRNEDDITMLELDIKECDTTLLKLYTKQDDNYILVWDKERGVI